MGSQAHGREQARSRKDVKCEVQLLVDCRCTGNLCGGKRSRQPGMQDRLVSSQRHDRDVSCKMWGAAACSPVWLILGPP